MVRAFLDSSFLVELLKGNRVAVNINRVFLSNPGGFILSYNHMVMSEFVYQICFKRGIDLDVVKEILSCFELLDMDSVVNDVAFNYMSKYHFKPNDALILATCKHYDIKYLVSLDSDFEKPCEKEGIVLIDSAEKLMEVLDGRDSD